MIPVYIDTHAPYPTYQTVYEVSTCIGNVVADGFSSYAEAAAWAANNGYCVIVGSMGWNCSGVQPACPLTVLSITAIRTSTIPDSSGYYNVKIDVVTNGTGTFVITKDGGEIHREYVANDVNTTHTYNWGFKYQAAAYTICAEVV